MWSMAGPPSLMILHCQVKGSNFESLKEKTREGYLQPALATNRQRRIDSLQHINQTNDYLYMMKLQLTKNCYKQNTKISFLETWKWYLTMMLEPNVTLRLPRLQEGHSIGTILKIHMYWICTSFCYVQLTGNIFLARIYVKNWDGNSAKSDWITETSPSANQL